MKSIVVFLLRCYGYVVSPFIGYNCRFYPSCSSYAETAVKRYGAVKGIGLAVRRLSRCHPWHEGGFDPVPELKEK